MDVKSFLSNLTNPNAFGEAIRDYVFAKKDPRDYGCYTTFDLISSFRNIDTTSEIGRQLLLTMGIGPGDDIPTGATLASDGVFVVAWFWDGDGTLLVGCGVRFAINEDCKKDYEWRWTRLAHQP